MRNVPLTDIEVRAVLLRAQEHRAAVEERYAPGDAVEASAPEDADVARWRAELAVRAAIVLCRIIRGESDNFVIDGCADLSAAAVLLRLATRDNAYDRA